MKNDQERENKLKEAIRDALSTVCWKDENGVFYEEIYADYRDTLDDRTLKKICNDDHPHEKFWELLDEWYRDCEWEYADNVIKRILEDEDVAELIENLDEDDKSSTDAVSEDGDSFVAAELKKAVKSIGKHPETDFDRALVSAQRLFDEEREVKKNVKNLRSALDEKTRTVIEGLSDEHADDLLAAKWVEPLQRKLEELPQTAVDELIAAVNALNDKYSTTYSDVCEQIEQAEAKLGNMLGQLTGNEFDMAGIAELKTLLGGE